MLQLTLLYLLTCLLTCLLMLAAHWYPWNRGAAPLHRLTAYKVGALGLVGLPVAAMLIAHALGLAIDTLAWAGLLLANSAAAGGATHLAWWIDAGRAVTLEDAYHAAPRNQ